MFHYRQAAALRHKYPVLKHKSQGHFVQPPAEEGVLSQAQVDVSALADILVEKFIYHMPLYRQHQKLQDEGFTLSRCIFDRLMHSAHKGIAELTQVITYPLYKNTHADFF